MSWDNILALGSVIGIDTCLWDCATRVTPATIGLNPKHCPKPLVALGSRFYRGHKEHAKMKILQEQAVKLVTDNGFPLPFGDYLIPHAVSRRVTKQLRSFVNQHNELLVELLEHYHAWRFDLCQEWSEQLYDWQTTHDLGASVDDIVDYLRQSYTATSVVAHKTRLTWWRYNLDRFECRDDKAMAVCFVRTGLVILREMADDVVMGLQNVKNRKGMLGGADKLRVHDDATYYLKHDIFDVPGFTSQFLLLSKAKRFEQFELIINTIRERIIELDDDTMDLLAIEIAEGFDNDENTTIAGTSSRFSQDRKTDGESESGKDDEGGTPA